MSSLSFRSIKGNMVGTPERCNSDRSARSFCGFQLILETRATTVSIFLRFLIDPSTNTRRKTRTLPAIETRFDAHSGSGSSDTRGGSQKRGKMIFSGERDLKQRIRRVDDFTPTFANVRVHPLATLVNSLPSKHPRHHPAPPKPTTVTRHAPRDFLARPLSEREEKSGGLYADLIKRSLSWTAVTAKLKVTPN